MRQSPDENRRFDTIVGKNKRNALRAVRALRVVSATNNPSGAATMSSRAIYRDASGMPRRAMPERNRQMTRLGHFLFCPKSHEGSARVPTARMANTQINN